MSSIEKAVDKFKRGRAQQGPKHDAGSQTKQEPTDQVPGGADQQARFCALEDDFLNHNGFLTRDVQNTVLAEEYRNLKRPILANIQGKGADQPRNANIVIVTSALSGEGKTFTSVNLALSMAMEKNMTALLIDADVVNPALTRMLGLSEVPGLIDVLLDENLTVADVIYKTNIPKLSIIPAGAIHSHAAELLASIEMKSVMDELSQRYGDRVVLLDAPPIMLTSHARVIVDLAGQVLFVVEAGETLQHDIVEAVSQVDKNAVVGMVLNKSRRRSNGNYYYGGYGSYPTRTADRE